MAFGALKAEVKVRKPNLGVELDGHDQAFWPICLRKIMVQVQAQPLVQVAAKPPVQTSWAQPLVQA